MTTRATWLLMLLLACAPPRSSVLRGDKTVTTSVCDELSVLLAELLHVHTAEERIARLGATCTERHWDERDLICVRANIDDVDACLGNDVLVDAMGKSGMWSGELLCDDATANSGLLWTSIATTPEEETAYRDQLRSNAARRACILATWPVYLKRCVADAVGVSDRDAMARCRARFDAAQESILAAELVRVDRLWARMTLLKTPVPPSCRRLAARVATDADCRAQTEELCTRVVDGRPLLDVNDRACIIAGGERLCRVDDLLQCHGRSSVNPI